MTRTDKAQRVALLVIDVQQGLCAGPYAAFDAQGVIARINQAIAKARAVGAMVVFVQHDEPEGLVYGSPWWQLAEGLQALPGDHYVRKQGSSAFYQTKLDELLKAHGVQRLIVCGLQSEFCVDSTVRNALERGYPVTLVEDAHTTMDNGVLKAAQISAHTTATLRHIGGYAGQVHPVAASDLELRA